jgi:hypothetical protein
LSGLAVFGTSTNTFDAAARDTIEPGRASFVLATRRRETKTLVTSLFITAIGIDHATVALLAKTAAVADLVYRAVVVTIAKVDIGTTAVQADLTFVTVVIDLTFSRHAAARAFDLDADGSFGGATHAVAQARLPTGALDAAL